MNNELTNAIEKARKSEEFSKWLLAFFKANGVTDISEINAIQVIVSNSIKTRAPIIKDALQSWLAGNIEYRGRLTAKAMIAIIKEHERQLDEQSIERERLERESNLVISYEQQVINERDKHDEMVASQIKERGASIERWQDVPQHIWFDYCTRQGYWKRLTPDEQRLINELGERLVDENEQPKSEFIRYPHSLQDTKRKLAIWIHVLKNEL